METKIQSDTAAAPLSLKERQRQERVELILQTAEAVLAEKSYHEMSMEEIAARVGIAKGTIYLHFPSKEDLVVAFFKKSLLAYLDGLAELTARPLPARERLKRILVESYSEQRKKQSQLFLSIFHGGNLRKEVLEKQFSMRDYFTKVAGHIRTVLEDGQASGEFNSSIPTQVMLTTFLALLNRPRYEEFLGEQLLSPEQLAEEVSRVYFHGISGK